jgi:hypothetical protein
LLHRPGRIKVAVPRIDHLFDRGFIGFEGNAVAGTDGYRHEKNH